MRPVALGRKNWVHIGSSQAGPKIAAILSVVESCRRLKLPVPDYLAAVSFRTRRSPDPTPPSSYTYSLLPGPLSIGSPPTVPACPSPLTAPVSRNPREVGTLIMEFRACRKCHLARGALAPSKQGHCPS